jgi:hypothetical protein
LKELSNPTYYLDPELTLRPDLSKTLKITKRTKYHHNGKWEETPGNAEETGHWSCCMGIDPASEGCVAVLVDKKKWNVTGF